MIRLVDIFKTEQSYDSHCTCVSACTDHTDETCVSTCDIVSLKSSGSTALIASGIIVIATVGLFV